jgi:hypothetical protein
MRLLTLAPPTRTARQHFLLTMMLLVLPTFISTLQLGKDYQSVLELPADLNPCNGRSLDEQVGLLHDIIAATFRRYCVPQDGDDAGYQYETHAEDSGCSGPAPGCSGSE